MSQVRGATHLPFVRAGRAEDALKIEAGDDVLHQTVTKVVAQFRIKGVKTGRKHNRADLYLKLFRFLVQIDRVGLAYANADLALALLQVETGRLIDISDQRYRLREVDMYRLVLGKFLVERIGYLDRTVVNADITAGTFLFNNITRLFSQSYLEVARLTFNAVNFGIGDDLDVWIARTFDELG